jgi:hypothetical protein
MVGVLVFKFSGNMLFSSFSFILTFLYFGFAYSQFINYQSRIKVFIKGGFVQLLGLSLMVSTVVLLVILLIVILPYISPETYELIRPSNNR